MTKPIWKMIFSLTETVGGGLGLHPYSLNYSLFLAKAELVDIVILSLFK